MSGLKVFSEYCHNCLFSKDRIVSGTRTKEILEKCQSEQIYFICHKASINGEKTVCKTFYDKFGHISQMVRIAERLNMVEFVPQTDTQKLTSYVEMNRKPRKQIDI